MGERFLPYDRLHDDGEDAGHRETQARYGITRRGANPESRAIFDHAVCATEEARAEWIGMEMRARTPLGVQLE